MIDPHFKPAAVAAMRAHAQRDPDAPEGCGLLVGRRYERGATIVDLVTEPSPTDCRARHSYDLDEGHHIAEAERLAALHEAGGEILGSWHTHPQADPIPSPQDLASWERVHAKEPWQMHVIVGTERAYVYRRNEAGGWHGLPLWKENEMDQEEKQLQEMAPGLPWSEERQYISGTERFEPLLRFFKHAHLPPHLAAVSKPFADLAHDLVRTLPKGAERTAAVRRLLESKDCAVRALLPVDDLECVAIDKEE